MFSYRGDAHRIYLTLRRQRDIRSNKELKEAAEIKSFYEKIDQETLKLILYRMIKEKNGTGIIPIFVTSIPWLLFLFSDKIQDVLFNNGTIIWAVFVSIYLVLLTVSTIFHFKEKAWAALHIEIIKDVLKKKEH
ncbi:hypothetical protein ACFO3D_16470 [Virgibacillus kekensis]|uniref:Uncharacterized protein n=1 Tax=Virgibacillus kekensis TaxID=202261 RepID=A0ABV9DLT8_9BACI